MNPSIIPEKCLWNEIDQAGYLVPEEDRPDQDHTEFDVLIIGAGYTGLWSAFYLHLNEPSLKIAVLEKNTIGYGASGRNGGWCSTIMPMSLDSIAKQHGRDQAIAMQDAMFATLHEIRDRTITLGIDCDFVQGGSLDIRE